MSGNPPSDLLALLREAVARAPSAPFLTDLRTGRCWTYDELWRGTCHNIALLAQFEVAAGDRVALLTKNDPVFFPLLFACAAVGAILVPIDRVNLRAEIDSILDDAKPTLVLHDERWESTSGTSTPVGWSTDDPPPVPPSLAGASDDVLIIYTSGTTGNAKGVTLTHQNLAAMARRFVSFYHLRPQQRFLSMLPFYHINAPMITGLVCVAAQAHVHLTHLYGFTNARSIFSLVEANGINVLSLTPSIMASLLQLNPDGVRQDLASLEFCFCGTAPLGESVWRRFEALVNAPVYQGYGLTETTTWATMTPPDAHKRYDTVGIPVGCEIRIDGDPTGEILIKGDIVMSGYHNRKKLTHKTLQDGWYHTGDVGYLAPDNQLIIAGRTKNIIKRNGVLIHPESIDIALQRSGFVAESGTVGTPDSLTGERVITACVLSQGSVDDVRAYLAAELSPYMRPDEIVPIHAIPRNSVGKPIPSKLRDLVSGDAAERVVQSFERSKVSRARSEQEAEIQSMIQQAILDGTPILFTGFWGVGHRTDVTEPDCMAIKRLADLRDDLDAALGHAQVSVSLLLADVHGRCNRVPEQDIDIYLRRIARLAAENGMQTRRLSELWRAGGLREADVATIASDSATVSGWQEFPFRDEFLTQAAHRCGNPEQAEEFAFRYYCTCLTERRMLTQALAGTIFFTYNAPKFRVILPEVPTVHWYSTKVGTTAKPWFM